MCWLPLWCHDQGAMANKMQQHKQTSVQGNQGRTSCFHQPDDLDSTRCHSATQGQAHQSVLQGSHHLCWPFFRSSIHTNDDKCVKQQNPQDKIGIRAIFSQQPCCHQTLSCSQWCFINNVFIAHCNQQQQWLTYCGANAHFQHGVAERAIQDLTKVRRKQLLHAMTRWPNAVNLALLPYALCYGVHVYNTVLVLSNGTLRLEKITSTCVGGACMQDHHTFACPVFTLQNAIPTGNIISRGLPCTQLGLNLGSSPFHARSVYLVLNLAISLVSPQYHCRFNDFFKTTHHNQPDIVTSATWKQLVGLCQEDGTPTTREPLENFAEPWRVMEECPTPAKNNLETHENSDNFLSIWKFPHEIGTNNNLDNSGNSTKNPVQDSEGATPTNLALQSAGTSSCGRQCKMLKAIVE